MSRYILIQPDEDGNPIRWLKTEDLENITQLMEDYGVREWTEDTSDPMYWPERQAMLLKVEICNPKAVKVVAKWKLP